MAEEETAYVSSDEDFDEADEEEIEQVKKEKDAEGNEITNDNDSEDQEEILKEYKFEVSPTLPKAWLVKVPEFVAKNWHAKIKNASLISTSTNTVKLVGVPVATNIEIGKLIK